MVKKSVFKFLFTLMLLHLVLVWFKLRVAALSLSQHTDAAADFVLVFLVKFSLNLNVKSSMVCVSGLLMQPDQEEATYAAFKLGFLEVM